MAGNTGLLGQMTLVDEAAKRRSRSPSPDPRACRPTSPAFRGIEQLPARREPTHPGKLSPKCAIIDNSNDQLVQTHQPQPKSTEKAQVYGPPYGQPAEVFPGQFASPELWIPRRERLPGCPPGLEYLTQLDQIVIHQEIGSFDAMTGPNTSNRFQINNISGQQIFFAIEEYDLLHFQFANQQRSFVIHITDYQGDEVITLRREHNFCAANHCCGHTLMVESPPGETIGYIVEQHSVLKPVFCIKDANEQVIFHISGPACVGQCSCSGDEDFNVTSADGLHLIGAIRKQWPGLTRGVLADADGLVVSFPEDLDVKMKVVVIGAAFLINLMYFENLKHHHH